MHVKTDHRSCVSCYAKNKIHCMSENHIDSQCGVGYTNNSKELKEWMASFKYCTQNLNSKIYKIYTCPGFKCPHKNVPKIITLN